MGRGSARGSTSRYAGTGQQWSLKKQVATGGCCGGFKKVPVICRIEGTTAIIGGKRYNCTDCSKFQESDVSIRFFAYDANTWQEETVELFGVGTGGHKEFALAIVQASRESRTEERKSASAGANETMTLTPPQWDEDNGQYTDDGGRSTPRSGMSGKAYPDGKPLKEQTDALTELVDVYNAMRKDYVSAFGKKQDYQAVHEGEEETDELKALDDSISVILMGRKAVVADIEKAVEELQKCCDWTDENDPDNGDLDAAEAVLKSAKTGPLADDEFFGQEDEAARAAREDAEGGGSKKPDENEEEDYEKKENELSDIESALGVGKKDEKINHEKIDLNVRTIVHGFEDKVSPGGIAKVLKPKNEKNWMLIEVKKTKEAHWVPAWAVSKGYFRTTKAEEGVCEENDLVEYLKGPVDGWVLVRNVTQHSKHAQWLNLDSLPEKALEPMQKGRSSGAPGSSTKDDAVRFQAFHDYKSKDGKIELKKGTELQLLSGPKNGWVGVVFLDGSKRKGYVPYWVMPHEVRPADAAASKKKAADHGEKSSSKKKEEAEEDVGDDDGEGGGAAAAKKPKKSSSSSAVGGSTHKSKEKSSGGGHHTSSKDKDKEKKEKKEKKQKKADDKSPEDVYKPKRDKILDSANTLRSGDDAGSPRDHYEAARDRMLDDE
mmetsp:Transcript_1993/g.4625  ORF Transcript_1993/g.4625 Transcript_1993/m.4625 type:complete len:660 (+) Transcript_1993:234-2213(+)